MLRNGKRINIFGLILENLEMVRDYFRARILHLEPDVRENVFRGLDDMIALHQTIVAELKASKNDVGKVLMKNFDKFGIYREYCIKLSRAQAMLQEQELR